MMTDPHIDWIGVSISPPAWKKGKQEGAQRVSSPYEREDDTNAKGCDSFRFKMKPLAQKEPERLKSFCLDPCAVASRALPAWRSI